MPPFFARTAGVNAVEALEQTWQIVVVYTVAIVPECKSVELGRLYDEFHAHLCTVGVDRSIFGKVGDHAAQECGVAAHMAVDRHIVAELHVAVDAGVVHVVFEREQQVVEVDIGERYFSSGFFKTCHSRHILKHGAQPVDILLSALQEARAGLVVHVWGREDRVDISAYHPDRGFQFVVEVVGEFTLHARR